MRPLQTIIACQTRPQPMRAAPTPPRPTETYPVHPGIEAVEVDIGTLYPCGWGMNREERLVREPEILG
jgi:hypothetical protein